MNRGLIEVKISGKNVQRFIKKIIKRNIYIDRIEIDSKVAYLRLDKDNFEKLQKIKTIYEIKVVKLYGIIKYIDLVKRHCIFLILLLLGYIYLLLISNIIFDVQVVHSKKKLRDLVYLELDKYNIKKYSFVKSYADKEKIEARILEDNKDSIEWIEIERTGSKYIVRLEERIIKIPKPKQEQRNVIAKKDGIIKSINAVHGEIVKKKEDYVKKGEVIISGVLTKNDEVKNIVDASGTVYAEVWYRTKIDIPFYYKEVINTNKKKKVLKLRFINKDFYVFNFNKYKTYRETELFTIKNSVLPVRVSFSLEEQTNVIEKILSKEEAIREAKRISDNKIQNMLSKNEKILKSKVISFSEYENYINVEVFYKVYENITDYKIIDKDEIYNKIKE